MYNLFPVLDGPCTDTLTELMNSRDVLPKIFKLIDCNEHVYRAIGLSCGLEADDFNHFERYSSLANPLTQNIFNACIEKCMEEMNESPSKMCNILRKVHQIDGKKNIFRAIFKWHTGRESRCPVCTRGQFQ